MSHFLFYNGQFLKNDKPLLTADNRAFRYGDGLFETMKAVQGRSYLEQYHFERLFHGLGLLQFELPAYFDAGYLAGQVATLCSRNNHSIARVRITVFRGNGGLYDPENHFPNCIIQSWPLIKAPMDFNENGLVTGIFTSARKSIDDFANLKSNNYLPYVMAALYAKKQKWNEALILNSRGNICDATIANIFLIKNKTIYTPSLTEGCVAGTMRQWLIEQLKGKWTVEEKPISEAEVLNADELFLTNAVQGLRWVGQCNEKKYGNEISSEIFRTVMKNIS